MIRGTIRKLVDKEDLTRAEVAQVMSEIADGVATSAQIGAFLTLLRAKGETVDEISGAADVVRARADRLSVDADGCVDTCGTGGDGQGTFNISTIAALVAAGAGARVAKHGNRSVSSRCGSADVLVALGVDVEAPRSVVERCLGELGIAFLFAQRHHSAFKAAAAVRPELGVTTLFNLLGPLANPAGARRQVMGVYDPRWVPIVGRVLASLGAEHAMVVHGEGLDEITLTGETYVCEVRCGDVREYRLRPEDAGLRRCPPSALAGDDAPHNAAIAREVLAGTPGPRRDAVLLNAAAALIVADRASSLREGVALAAEAIDGGAAAGKLAALARLTSEVTS